MVFDGTIFALMVGVLDSFRLPSFIHGTLDWPRFEGREQRGASLLGS